MSTKNHKHLRFARSKWYYNRRIPKALLNNPVFGGKKNFLKSLGTDSLSTALMERDRYNVWFNNLLMTEKSNPTLADELENLTGLPDLDKRLMLDRWLDEVATDYPWVGSPQWNPEDPSTPPMPDIEAMKYIALKKSLGEEISDELKPVEQRGRLTLKQALERVMKEKELNNLSDKGIYKYTRASELFHAYNPKKDVYVHSITRGNTRDFIYYCKQKGTADSTIKGYLSPLSVLWKHARDYEDLNTANPFDDWADQFNKESTACQNWTKEELTNIYNTSQHNQDKLMIYIAWYTGARIDEITDLTADNIYKDKESGIRYLYFKENTQGKNKFAKRQTPIHKHLESMLKDFERFDQRTSSNAFSKAFTEAKKRAGYGDRGREYCFHSIRGMTSTELENLECPENIVDRITGHTAGQGLSFQRYSKGVGLEVMNKYIQRLPDFRD